MFRIALPVITLTSLLTGLQSPTASADFAFRFESEACRMTDVFDTFQAQYTKAMGPEVPAISITVMLPPESEAEVYQAVMAAGFFNIPSPLNPALKTQPLLHYRLEVRNDGMTHTVSWMEGSDPSMPQLNKLKELAATLYRLISSLPEVQRLPKPNGICI